MAVSKKIYKGQTRLNNRRKTVYNSPRLKVEFQMDRSGIRRIAVGRELADAVHSVVVNRAMVYAIQIAPRRTLDYVSSFRASDGYIVIAGMRRVASKLVNVSGHAAAVEFVNARGNGNGARVLGKTLDHLNSITVKP